MRSYVKWLIYWLNLVLILTLLSGLLSPLHLAAAAAPKNKMTQRNDFADTSPLSTAPRPGEGLHQPLNRSRRLLLDGRNGPQGIQLNAPLLAPAFTVQQVAKLTIVDSNVDLFGQSVAIEGDTAVVGAFRPLGNSGLAYLFERVEGNWFEQSQFGTSDEGDFFARRVAISGARFIVGANDGAYVYSPDGEGVWAQEARLEDCDITTNRDVALSGNLALVAGEDDARVFELGSGSPADPCDSGGGGGGGGAWHEPAEPDQEVVLLASIDGGPLWFGSNNMPPADFGGEGNWAEQATLVGSDTFSGDDFGHSIAIEGDTALIGAPFHQSAGAAYIFQRDAEGVWTQAAKLLASDRAIDDQFGWSVALSGDYAIVGAKRKDNSTGAAYIFKRDASGWGQNCTGTPVVCEESQQLRASNGDISDDFGFSVAIEGDNAVVGALAGDSPPEPDTGAAYLFTLIGGNWGQNCSGSPLVCEETDILTAGDGAVGDEFGNNVALSGDTILIGAESHGSKGAVYVFEIEGSQTFSISGQVTWTQSGNPISGVTIEPAPGSDPFTAVETDENGNYLIEGLAPGDYKLEANRLGYTFESAADGSDTIQVQITNANVPDQNFVAVSAPPPVIPASHGFKGAGWLRYDDGSEDTNYVDNNIGWNVERSEDILVVRSDTDPLRDLPTQIEILSNSDPGGENVDTLVRIDTPDATGPIRLRGLDHGSTEYQSNLNELNQLMASEDCSGIEDWMEDLDQFYLQVIGLVPSVDKFIFANEPNHHRDEWDYTAEQYAFVYNCYYTRWLEHEFEEGVGRRPHALYVAGPGQEPGRAGYQWEDFLPELFNNLDRADGFTMHVYGYDEDGDPTGNTLFKLWLNSIMSNMDNHAIADDKPLIITEYNPGAVVGSVNTPSNGWTDWLERTYCWALAAQQTYPDVRLRGFIYFVDEPDQWRNHDSNGAWYPVSLFSDNNRRQVWLNLDNDFSGLGYAPSSGNYIQWCLDGSGSLRWDDLTTLYASIGDIELQFKQKSHSPTAQSSSSNQIGGVISGTLGVWGDSTVYYVTDDLEVPAGQTLTIEAGTTLVFSPTHQLTVAGQLEAKGNTVFPVRFTSEDEAGWEGIHILSSAVDSHCVGCSLENIQASGVALQVEAPLALQSSFIRDVPGGTAISSTVPITLSHTVIDYVDTGIYLSGQSNQTHDISHITMTRCEMGVVNRGQILNLDNSIITTCSIAVSTELSGTTTISYTLFDGNGQDFATEIGSNLSQGPGLLNASADFVDFPNDVTLQATSTAVNAADPQAPFERELGFNGGRADLGAYGNSWRAPQQPPLSQMAVTLVADTPTLTGHPGETISYTLTLQNSGSVTDTYGMSAQASDLRLTTSFAENNDQEYYFVELAPQTQISVTVWVQIPLTSTLNVSNTILVRAVGRYDIQTEIELTTLIAPSFQEENGLVVMEAEHYAANIERSNRGWLTQTTVSGYTGEGYMEALPDTDLQFTVVYTTTSPELSYTINFTTTGVYTVWLRGYAGNAAGDSLYIGLEGQPNVMVTGFDPQEWSWVTDNSQGSSTTIEITQSGIHKLQIWQREDGVRLDRILLTTDSGYNPTGNGPPESDLR